MKVALIIASKNFRDEEYFIPKQILENAGIVVSAISGISETAIGSEGGEVIVDILIEDLNVEEFDAVVFIGGSGALAHLDNEKSYEIAKAAVDRGKILGAICISPTILAKAGVLQEKRATVWSSPLYKSAIKVLENNGAIYKNEKVVIDNKIITANGPGAAREFGEKIVDLLK